MSNPLFHPDASGNQSPTQVQYGLSNSQAQIPRFGDYCCRVSDTPAASTETPQPKCSSESAASILKHFGLDFEDLELLITYPKDQITLTKLPPILHKIRLEKRRKATAAIQSKPEIEPEPATAQGDSLNAPGAAGMGQEKTILSDLKNIQEPLQKNTAELKSSAVGSSNDQASSVLRPAASPSIDQSKQLQMQPNQPLQNISTPMTDTEISVKFETSKPVPLNQLEGDQQSTLETLPSSTVPHPSCSGVVFAGKNEASGTVYLNKPQGQRSSVVEYITVVQTHKQKQVQQRSMLATEIQKQQAMCPDLSSPVAQPGVIPNLNTTTTSKTQVMNNKPLLPRKAEDQRSPPRRAEYKRSPPRRARDQWSPPRRARDQWSPPRRAEYKRSPSRRAEDQRSPPRRAEDPWSPPRRPDDKRSPSRRARDQRSPPRRADDKRSPPRRAEDKRSPPGRAVDKRSPSRRADDKRSPSRMADDKRSPSRRARDQRSPLRRAEDKRSPSRRTEDQRLASRKVEDKQSPSRKADDKWSPSRKADDKESPSRKASYKRSPSRKDDKLSPSRKVDNKQSPSKKTGDKRSPSRRAEDQRSPPRRAEDPWSPSRRARDQRSPPRRADDKRSPPRRAEDKRSPPGRAVDKRSPSRRAVDKRSPSRRADDKRSPSRMADDKRSPSRRARDQRSPLRRAEDKRSPSRRTEDQRLASRKVEDKQSPSRKADDKWSPSRKADDKESPSRKASYKRSPSRKDDKLSPSRKVDNKQSPSKKTGDKRSPSRKVDYKESPSRKADDRSTIREVDNKQSPSGKVDIKEQSRPRMEDDKQSPARICDERRQPQRKDDRSGKRSSPQRRSSETQSSPEKTDRSRCPDRLSLERSPRKGSSPQRKRSNSAESLARKQLETPAVQSKSEQSELETHVPAFGAEPVKMSSTSTTWSTGGEEPSLHPSTSRELSSPPSCSSSSTEMLKEGKIIPLRAQHNLQKNEVSFTNTKRAKVSPPTMVNLQGIGMDLSRTDVVDAMKHFGKTKSVLLFRTRLEANVCFENEEDANKLKCLKTLNVKGATVTVVSDQMDVTLPEFKPPLEIPATPSISQHLATSSTKTPTSIASPDAPPLTGNLPCGAKTSTAAKHTIQRSSAKVRGKRMTAINLAKVLLSKAKYGLTKQFTQTIKRKKFPVKGEMKPAEVKLATSNANVFEPKEQAKLDKADDAEPVKLGLTENTAADLMEDDSCRENKWKEKTSEEAVLLTFVDQNGAREPSTCTEKPLEATGITVSEQEPASSKPLSPEISHLTSEEMIEKENRIGTLRCVAGTSPTGQVDLTDDDVSLCTSVFEERNVKEECFVPIELCDDVKVTSPEHNCSLLPKDSSGDDREEANATQSTTIPEIDIHLVTFSYTNKPSSPSCPQVLIESSSTPGPTTEESRTKSPARASDAASAGRENTEETVVDSVKTCRELLQNEAPDSQSETAESDHTVPSECQGAKPDESDPETTPAKDMHPPKQGHESESSLIKSLESDSDIQTVKDLEGKEDKKEEIHSGSLQVLDSSTDHMDEPMEDGGQEARCDTKNTGSAEEQVMGGIDNEDKACIEQISGVDMGDSIQVPDGARDTGQEVTNPEHYCSLSPKYSSGDDGKDTNAKKSTNDSRSLPQNSSQPASYTNKPSSPSCPQVLIESSSTPGPTTEESRTKSPARASDAASAGRENTEETVVDSVQTCRELLQNEAPDSRSETAESDHTVPSECPGAKPDESDPETTPAKDMHPPKQGHESESSLIKSLESDSDIQTVKDLEGKEDKKEETDSGSCKVHDLSTDHIDEPMEDGGQEARCDTNITGSEEQVIGGMDDEDKACTENISGMEVGDTVQVLDGASKAQEDTGQEGSCMLQVDSSPENLLSKPEDNPAIKVGEETEQETNKEDDFEVIENTKQTSSSGEDLPAEGCKIEDAESQNPKEDQQHQEGDNKDPDMDGTEEEAFQILDSTDVSQELETSSPQLSKDTERPLEEEGDTDQVVSSLEDQPTTTETETDLGKVESVKEEESVSGRYGRSLRRSIAKSKEPKSEEKDKSPKKPHKIVKTYETRAGSKIVESAKEEPVAATEQCGRRRSTRGKNEDGAKIDLMENEPTVTTRSTRGRRGDTMKDVKTLKEDMPTKLRRSREKTPKKGDKEESTPPKENTRVRKTSEEDAVNERPDSEAQQPATRAKRKTGTPKEPTETTKKGQRTPKKVDKNATEKETASSVEDENVDDFPSSDKSISGSHDNTQKSTSLSGMAQKDDRYETKEESSGTEVDKDSTPACGAPSEDVFDESLPEKVPDPPSFVEVSGTSEIERMKSTSDTEIPATEDQEKSREIPTDEFVEEPEVKAELSKAETRPLSLEDEPVEDQNQETLVTCYDEGDKPDKEPAQRTLRSRKRKHDDSTDDVKDPEDKEASTPRTRGSQKKKTGQTPVRKSPRGVKSSSQEVEEKESADEAASTSCEVISSSNKNQSKLEIQETPEVEAESQADEEAASTGLENKTLDEGEEEKKGRRRAEIRVVSKQRKDPVGPEAKRLRSQSPPAAADFKHRLSPHPSAGKEFIVPGFFCNLCSVFCPCEKTSKELHRSSQEHKDNLQKHQTLQQKSTRVTRSSQK